MRLSNKIVFILRRTPWAAWFTWLVIVADLMIIIAIGIFLLKNATDILPILVVAGLAYVAWLMMKTICELPPWKIRERQMDSLGDRKPSSSSVISKIRSAFSRILQPPVQHSISPSDIEWVVNDLTELGVRIYGRCFFLYKGRSLEYSGKHDDGSPMMVRIVGKREFGECCHPLHIDPILKRYTRELTHTPGLSDGTMDDGSWKPMPSKTN